MKKIATIILFCVGVVLTLQISTAAQTQYKVLATKKTSTMQKELQEAADGGYRFEGVSGGGTSFGGSEVLVIMSKKPDVDLSGRFQYKLLATSKTSTIQKEIQEAGDNGFEYKGQAVFDTFIGGDEVVVIMEKDTKAEPKKLEYKLFATKKTSTMQKEINEGGEGGYEYVGVTVGKTLIGGSEVVVIMRRGAKSLDKIIKP
ncbi:MAG TPA: hypothetical protein VNI84_01520 [Pyrinomonadaceae bacterium]|nr:hypothetical protein [Pyrinomonadaceae bacterium]